MANEIEKLIDIIRDDSKIINNIHSARVSRIDKDGSVWVFINGSDQETPIASSSSEVKKGDAVNVEWRNNKLYIEGNYSDPSAGSNRVSAAESAANHAVLDARRANTAAVAAEAEALRAGIAADRAEGKADDAARAADDAQTSADTAEDAAQTAYNSSISALTSLSQVEDVLGTLNWITEHGSYLHTKEVFSTEKIYYQVENAVYAASSDTEVDPDKDYYTLSGGVYTWVVEPTGNPSTSGYYEMTSGDFEQVVGTLVTYALTTDTEIDESKTYYVSDGSGGYEVVIEPVQADIGSYYEAVVYNLPRAEDVNTYYELKIDEAISNYVASHLSLSSSGLWLQMDGTDAKLQLSPTDGLVLYGTDGTPVATYSEGIVLGDRQGFHITIDPTNGIVFWQNETRVAYINSNMLEIPRSLMLESIQIGSNKWEWKKQADDNLTLTWIGGTANGNS